MTVETDTHFPAGQRQLFLDDDDISHLENLRRVIPSAAEAGSRHPARACSWAETRRSGARRCGILRHKCGSCGPSV